MPFGAGAEDFSNATTLIIGATSMPTDISSHGDANVDWWWDYELDQYLDTKSAYWTFVAPASGALVFDISASTHPYKTVVDIVTEDPDEPNPQYFWDTLYVSNNEPWDSEVEPWRNRATAKVTQGERYWVRVSTNIDSTFVLSVSAISPIYTTNVVFYDFNVPDLPANYTVGDDLTNFIAKGTVVGGGNLSSADEDTSYVEVSLAWRFTDLPNGTEHKRDYTTVPFRASLSNSIPPGALVVTSHFNGQTKITAVSSIVGPHGWVNTRLRAIDPGQSDPFGPSSAVNSSNSYSKRTTWVDDDWTGYSFAAEQLIAAADDNRTYWFEFTIGNYFFNYNTTYNATVRVSQFTMQIEYTVPTFPFDSGMRVKLEDGSWKQIGVPDAPFRVQAEDGSWLVLDGLAGDLVAKVKKEDGSWEIVTTGHSP